MQQTIIQAGALILPLVIGIVFHEVAHGMMARRLGDPTAHEQRRLSLNPLRHVEPVGTVVLPGMLALAGAPVFGWAKPVPVNRERLNNPRFGMMAVALAGPLSNLILAAIGAVLLGLMARTDATGGILAFIALNLRNFVLINIFLALFNLLPIPPFDGSHVVEGLLPRGAARAYAKLRPYGFPLLFLLLLVVPYSWPDLHLVERILLPPVDWATDRYDALARLVAGP
ncbi:site-2 protease family protein [Sphingobium sp.]|uniref:site-2 protease family protein n=1 Tax=Sphingobium sp. TaxID=1912891 RepID=UPI002C7ECA01|nr:site-2 protease family protein [Sphingobium sp.]HUD90299.1 site-2 protease family protein [Sphingobium sp.]